jgi:hypothetical protein
MTDKEALQAFARGESLVQPIVKRLWRAGLIEVANVTKTGSTERQYLPTYITRRGQQAMKRAKEQDLFLCL